MYSQKARFFQRGTVVSGTSKVSLVRGRAGKSLDRQGRKQDTKTKLGIYSTYSSRRSIHFLARCFNICKPLKKFGILSVQPGLYGSNDIRVGRKMANIVLFNPGKRWYSAEPHPKNRVGDQDNGSPGRPVSSGLQVPREPGHCTGRKTPPS